MTSRLIGGFTAAIGLAALFGAPAAARAANTSPLTFEGLKNDETVANYYNGGLGGSGSGPGPNYGVTFGTDAIVTIQDEDGGTGNFANSPTPDTCLFFLTGTGDMLNVPGGFSTGFSFYYSAINNPGSVQVFSGPNDTGTELANLVLPVTPEILPAPDNGLEQFDNWQPIGVTFTGVAESVDFAGTANQIGFDNITLNSATPSAPEPAALGLIGVGVLLLPKRGARRVQK